MKETKDESLTYERIIKEISRNKDTKKDTEAVAELDYDELCRQVQNLHYLLDEERNTNIALKYSLNMMYKEMTDWKNHSDMWEEYYYREHKRAEKLYDELEKLKNEKDN